MSYSVVDIWVLFVEINASLTRLKLTADIDLYLFKVAVWASGIYKVKEIILLFLC
mgnify:CR=1 FL=1